MRLLISLPTTTPAYLCPLLYYPLFRGFPIAISIAWTTPSFALGHTKFLPRSMACGLEARTGPFGFSSGFSSAIRKLQASRSLKCVWLSISLPPGRYRVTDRPFKYCCSGSVMHSFSARDGVRFHLRNANGVHPDVDARERSMTSVCQQSKHPRSLESCLWDHFQPVGDLVDVYLLL